MRASTNTSFSYVIITPELIFPNYFEMDNTKNIYIFTNWEDVLVEYKKPRLAVGVADTILLMSFQVST